MSSDPTRPDPNAVPAGTRSFAAPGAPGETASFTPNGDAARPEVLPDVPGYELTGVLGRGGMGVVYLARQLATNRQVAVKMLPLDGSAGAAGPARFAAEVEATARPSHPNIVQVYEAGEACGRAYFVCEYIAGGSLATHIDGTPWPADRAAKLLAPLARALAAAHASHIVHRDIKPSNVLLTPDGTPKIADFGVAKRLGAEPHTHTGAVLGTPSYMAPEQAGGAKTVGPPADVYGLGAVLYEVLTGRAPFAGADFLDTLDQVRTRDPIPPRTILPKLPRDIETICLKCLQKDPARRYASADALADDLDRFLAGRPIVARPVGVTERAWKWVKRNRALSAAAAGVALALLAGTAVASVFAVQARREADRAAASELLATQKATEADDAARRAAADRDAARDAERESRRRMVWLKLMAANLALVSDSDAALLWFHQAWELDRADASAEASHRARLAGLLQTTPDLVGACFHPDQVCDAAFSPGSARVLARTTGNEAYVWDYEQSRLIAPPLAHTGRVRHCCWSPDGAAIATASADGTAAVWDAKTGARRHTLTHDGPVNWVAFHPKEHRVVTAAEDATVRLWDTDTGKQLPWALPGGAVIDYVAFSPGGTRLLTAGRDDAVRVWSFDPMGPPQALSPALPYRASTPTERYQFHFDRWPRFSPDGKTVASFKGEDLIIWQESGNAVKTFNLGYGITEVYFIDANRLLATGNKYNRVAVVTVADGKDVYVLQHPRQANIGGVSPDGRYLITASSGGVIHLWDAATGAPARAAQRCGDFASAVCFSHDSKRCLASSQDGTIRVWAVAPRAPEVYPYKPDGRAHYLTLPVGGARERVTGPDGRASVEFGGGAAQAVLAPGATPVAIEHPEPVTAVLFAGSGERFVVFGGNTVRAWEAKLGKFAGPPVQLPAAHTPPKGALESATHDRLSRDGTRLAVWDDPKTVSVWDLGAGKRVFGPWRNDNPGPLVFGPKEQEGVVNGLALSSDGRLVAAATDSSGSLTVLDADTGAVLHKTRRYRGYVQGFGFSADSRRILLWASDNTARVYDSRSGTPVGPALRPALAKTQYVRVNPNECAISDDGRRLAFFESVSGTVRLWDAERADALLSVTVPERKPASRMWFAPDGSRVNLVVEGKALGVVVPQFDVPVELTGPLVRLLTGQRIDETDGIEFVDQFTFRNDLATYRRAFLTWRGLPDDPAAQPGRR